jgi:hypothetical protein
MGTFQTRMMALVVLALLAATAPAAAAAAGAPEVSLRLGPNQRQLFLDLDDVLQTSGITQQLHRPQKKGAVIRPPGLNGTLQARSAPQWVAAHGRYELLVESDGQWHGNATGSEPTPHAGALGTGCPHCAGTGRWWFVSRNGLTWTLGNESMLAASQAVYDAGERNASRRYKAVQPNAGAFTSADGVNWSKVEGSGAVPTGDQTNLAFDRESRTFIYTAKRTGPNGGRAVAVATFSAEFGAAADLGVVFHRDAIDERLGRASVQRWLQDSHGRYCHLDALIYIPLAIYIPFIFHIFHTNNIITRGV